MRGSRKLNSVCSDTRELWLKTDHKLIDHKLIVFTQIYTRKILASENTADKIQMDVEERPIQTDFGV